MPVLIAPVLAAGLGISTGTASILASIVFAAGSMLLSYLLAPKPPKPEDGKISFKQTVPPRGYGYGRTRVAGAVMFLETDGYDKLFRVNALLSHRCHAFIDLYLHEDKVTVNGSDMVSFPGSRYSKDDTHIKVFRNLGVVPETAFSEIVSLSDLWTSSHRGDGICSLGMWCKDASPENQQSHYPFGMPEPSYVLDAALVYDPRDVAQDPDDESTWVWSDNPVLCLMHYICFSEFGMGRDYETTILPYVEDWKTEADRCDDLVPRPAGGTEKRFRLGGNATTENEQKAILALMLASCDGWLVDRGDGGIDITVGFYRAPTVTLGDNDIVGFNIPYGRSEETAVNRLAITFTDPSNKYSEVEVKPFEDVAHQTQVGKILEHKYELTWVQSGSQARRLGKREFQRLTSTVTGTLHIKIDAISAAYERWIKIESDQIPQLNGLVIENRKAYISLLTGTVRIDFIAIDPDTIEEYEPSEDDDPDVVEDPVIPVIALNNLSVTVQTGFDAGLKIYYPYLRVSFDDPGITSSSITYRILWRYTDSNGIDQEVFEDKVAPTASGGSIILTTDLVDQNASVDVYVFVLRDGEPATPTATVDTTITENTLEVDVGVSLQVSPGNILRV